MTHGEIMDTLRKRPDIAELITAYKEAKEKNPTGTAQALPIILKLLLDGQRMTADSFPFTGRK